MTNRRQEGLLGRAATICWQLVGISIIVAVGLWLAGQLRVVLIPIAVATLLVRALHPLNLRLRQRQIPRGVAALTTLVAFLAVLAGLIALIVPATTDEFSELGPTLTDALEDVETWIVESGPFDLSRADLREARDRTADRVGEALRSSEGSLTGAAALLVEIPTGGLLTLLLSFFLLKDGDRFVAWTRRLMPAPRLELADRLARRTWSTLGGFLRGAATLGLVESAIISITMLIVGASLIVPVALITFAAAFVPVAGALVAGILAVLVTLVTAGPEQALVVAGVALIVQQLDNDLLAPVIYGRELQVHPAVILVAVVAGGALFGIIGTFFAVPAAAIAIGIGSELRASSPPADDSVPTPDRTDVAPQIT